MSAQVPEAPRDRQAERLLIRLGQRRDYVSRRPVWDSIVTLIPDEITKAANGQIVLTATFCSTVSSWLRPGRLLQKAGSALLGWQ